MIPDKTIAYHSDPRNLYAKRTVNDDMNEGYSHFLNYLPLTETIMDLGCGSSRNDPPNRYDRFRGVPRVRVRE